MPRKVVLNYNTQQYYKDMIDDFIKDNKERIINVMLKELNYPDTDKLWEDEYKMKWGLDCGWIYLVPKDLEMKKEWNKRESWYKFRCNTAYKSQSITIQRPQVELIVSELHLDDIFYIEEYLD